MSRRGFLGSAGAAASVVALARPRLAGASDHEQDERLDVDVAVCGVSLGGLVVAHELRRRGRAVVVLDDGSSGGGEPCLLRDHGRLDALARSLGVRVEPIADAGSTIEGLGDGTHTIADDGAFSAEGTSVAEIRSALTKLDRMAGEVDVAAPGAGVNAVVRDGRTLGAWLDDSIAGRRAHARLVRGFELVFGAPASEVSLLFALLAIAGAGGSDPLLRAAYYPRSWVPEGLDAFTTPLRSRLERHVRPGTIASVESEGAAVVIDASTCTVTARALVATHDLDALSVNRRVANRTGPGTAAAVVCRYPGTPWRADGRSGRVLGDGAPLHTVQPVDDGRSLVAVIAGEAARTWSTGDEEERRAAVLDALGRWLGPSAAKPLGYREVSGPNTARVVAPPGAITALGQGLREPSGAVHRAGPETSTAWLSHPEGLVDRGERVAAEVAAALEE